MERDRDLHTLREPDSDALPTLESSVNQDARDTVRAAGDFHIRQAVAVTTDGRSGRLAHRRVLREAAEDAWSAHESAPRAIERSAPRPGRSTPNARSRAPPHETRIMTAAA